MLGCGHGQRGSACVSPWEWLAQAVQHPSRMARNRPLIWVSSSTWVIGGRTPRLTVLEIVTAQQKSAKPSINLDVKDPDCEAEAVELADL